MSQIDRVLRSNLRLRHLQLLVALDRFRQLGRAADFLALTQPAVSKMLAEVERLYGVALFTPRGNSTSVIAAPSRRPPARWWCASRDRCCPTTPARATR